MRVRPQCQQCDQPADVTVNDRDHLCAKCAMKGKKPLPARPPRTRAVNRNM